MKIGKYNTRIYCDSDAHNNINSNIIPILTTTTVTTTTTTTTTSTTTTEQYNYDYDDHYYIATSSATTNTTNICTSCTGKQTVKCLQQNPYKILCHACPHAVPSDAYNNSILLFIDIKRICK